MALNWMRTVKVTRGGGASVVRGAAYRSSTKLVEERAVNAAAYRSGDTIQGGKHTYDYSRKDGVLHSEILAPDHTPARLRDRGTLWNEADRIERNKNSQLARDWLFPLPKELTNEQNLAMIRRAHSGAVRRTRHDCGPERSRAVMEVEANRLAEPSRARHDDDERHPTGRDVGAEEQRIGQPGMAGTGLRRRGAQGLARPSER